jgi:two-component system, NarL family, response regulator NreC
MSAAIRVLICDDHALVRAGLQLLLDAQPDIDVVAEAASGEEAVEQTRRLAPDVVLLDVVLPGRSGVDVLPDVLAAAPKTRVVMLSMQDDPTYVRKSFAAGASGYVPKEAADVELVHAVREVAAGHRFVHPTVGARLAAADAEADTASPDPLSEREHEVLHLLALGHTNQEIAAMLAISVRTVETHRARVMEKLGLKTRAELVRHAIATGQLAPLDYTAV